MFTACSGGAKDYNNLSEEEFEKLELVDESQLAEVYTNPDNFKGKRIKLTGKVFAQPEQADGVTAFQMFQNVKDSSNNTVVQTKVAIDLKSDDYAQIDAVITGTFKGENAFGGEIKALQVTAYKVEKTDYATAVSPVLHTIQANASKTQHKVTVTIQKVEFAADETRMYVKVANKSKYKVSVYSFNMKVIQGGKQYEEQSNYHHDYPKLPSDIAKGVTAEGVVALPKFDHTKSFQVTVEAYSSDYSVDMKDYEITIKP